jgi:thymidine kinase
MPAKLFFYYSAMNAGKSSTLLQASYNYNERGMRTLLFIPKLIGTDKIASRIGLSAPAKQFEPDFDFFSHMQEAVKEAAPREGSKTGDLGCVLVDECQFLNRAQVIQLTRVADELQVPVLCYGLRADFVGEPFEGSKYLLTYADVLSEIKTICWCGRKATLNQRVNADGRPVASGAQVEVGGNDRYVGKCRLHFHQGLEQARAAEAALAAKAEPVSQESNPPPAKQRKLNEVTPEKKETDGSPLLQPVSPPSA